MQLQATKIIPALHLLLKMNPVMSIMIKALPINPNNTKALSEKGDALLS